MANVEALSTSKYIIIVVNAFTAVTAIVFNSLTIQAIRKTPSLPKPLKTLLLSLAVSDVAVGLIAQPFLIVNLNIVFKTFPKMLWVIQLALANASFLGIVALSLDRFLAVHLHLRYQELVTHKRILGQAISAWVFSALLPLFYVWIDEIKKLINITIIIWSLCFIFITVISVRLYFAVRHHANQIQALQVQEAAQNGDLANASRLRKSAVSIFYVYFVFLACYLPFYCTFLAGDIFKVFLISKNLFYFSQTLMFINSTLNPVIYCWRMRDIRRSIKDILRNIFRRT